MRQFERSEMILGRSAMERLYKSRVAVFGLGGVGSYAAEALSRTGTGSILLVDFDTISETNINRQIIALHSTVGQYKTEALKNRISDINPNAEVITENIFFNAETMYKIDFSSVDYIIDAVDSVTSKILLCEISKKTGIKIISAMGGGNKLCPEKFEAADISQTSVCPLARVMRKELKRRGIEHVKVVYSKETPAVPEFLPNEQTEKRSVPGSVAFVPSVMGLIMAGEVIKDLTGGGGYPAE